MSKQEVNPETEPDVTVRPESKPEQKVIVTELTRRFLVGAGIVSIVLGILAFIFPENTLTSMTPLFAIFSIFIAVIDLMLFSKSTYLRGAFLMSALLSTVLGLIFLFRQDVTKDFSSLIFGFWILFNATSMLAQSWSPELLRNWQRLITLALGAVGLGMGLYLTLVSDIPASTMTTLIGIFSDISGIFFLFIALFSPRHKN